MGTGEVPIPDIVQQLVDERLAARTIKDWARSDQLRARIAELGFSVEDSKTATKVRPLD